MTKAVADFAKLLCFPQHATLLPASISSRPAAQLLHLAMTSLPLGGRPFLRGSPSHRHRCQKTSCLNNGIRRLPLGRLPHQIPGSTYSFENRPPTHPHSVLPAIPSTLPLKIVEQYEPPNPRSNHCRSVQPIHREAALNQPTPQHLQLQKPPANPAPLGSALAAPKTTTLPLAHPGTAAPVRNHHHCPEQP